MPMCHANSLYFSFTFTYLGATCVIDDHQQLRAGGAAAHARRAARDVHVAGADALHHDARPARRREAQVRRQPHQQADDLVGARAPRDEARDHGALRELAALRALRLHRGRLGDAPAPARADHEAGLRRPRVDGLGPDQAARPVRRRGARRRRRRALLAHAVRVRRLLEEPGEDGRGIPRRVVLGGRHGAARRGRLLPPRRPQEQHDHQRRREHLPVGSRAPARRPPGRAGRRGRRRCPTPSGARPCARWSCAARARPPPRRSILAWCRDRIAGYKRPRAIRFIEEAQMPRTATGKIQHRALRDKVAGRA